MRRRDFLAMSAAAVGTFAARRTQAQEASTRAAIVIGVDKAGNLPKLSGAALGADTVGNWLKAEGFQVFPFVDSGGPVTARPIKKQISQLIERGMLEQLVVYFAGHGFMNRHSEYWMLSECPEDSNEAFSLVESVEQAKLCGIPSIVLISDACRSLPSSMGVAQVEGSLLFPAVGVSGRVKVDKFMATLPGRAADEIKVDASSAEYEGVYTSCLLSAFQKPDEDMVLALPDGHKVIPNRRLEAYLSREVPKRVRAKNPAREQIPVTDVLSDEPTYIARVATDFSTNPAPAKRAANLFDVVSHQIDKVQGRRPNVTKGPSGEEVDAVAAASGFDTTKATILKATAEANRNHVDTGFIVSGTDLKAVVAGPNVRIEVSGNVVRIKSDDPAASVALHFADGSGTVVPALRYCEGHIVVRGTGVATVNYDLYGAPPPEVHELRAIVATAAKFGVFRIQGDNNERKEKARQIGDTIRMGKGADPTLGLYAAYAYNDADSIEQVRSVQAFMYGNLHVHLFDIAMLAGDLNGRAVRGDVVPFCPMLSQGWEFLRVKDVRMPESVREIRNHLVPALWTTFDPRGMEMVSDALKNGKLL